MAQKRAEPGRAKSSGVVKKNDSKKGFYIGLAAIAVIGIAALSYMTSQKSAGALITLDPSLPAISQGYVIGSPTAPVELVEFGDFECPSCAQFAALTEPDLKTHYVNTGKIRFRYVDFPLSIHPNSPNASNAAACMDEQGKFWEMKDLLYQTQHEWNSQVNRDPDKYFKALGRRVPGIDGGKLDECIDSRRMINKVQSHLKLALERNAGGTPTFVVGNQIVNLRTNSFDDWKEYLDGILPKDSLVKPLGDTARGRSGGN